MKYNMNILGMRALLTNTAVAKDIQYFTFPDLSKIYIVVFVSPRRPKHLMVAMEIRFTESCLIEKKKVVVLLKLTGAGLSIGGGGQVCL